MNLCAERTEGVVVRPVVSEYIFCRLRSKLSKLGNVAEEGAVKAEASTYACEGKQCSDVYSTVAATAGSSYVDRAREDHLGNFSNHAVHRSHSELSPETGFQKAGSSEQNPRSFKSIQFGIDDYQFTLGLVSLTLGSLSCCAAGFGPFSILFHRSFGEGRRGDCHAVAALQPYIPW